MSFSSGYALRIPKICSALRPNAAMKHSTKHLPDPFLFKRLLEESTYCQVAISAAKYQHTAPVYRFSTAGKKMLQQHRE
ncbi:hypothetical protein R3I93_013603 [Phoxinus phoxinus]|uniref:Uncharacterized protein n=1 Tax=Phoxinus phoxinus TaxID=58324 RepID=A0AAN9CRV8_9TELE